MIRQGDVLDVLRGEPDNSFDALFCDPPYGLSFMGKHWDYQVPGVGIWSECLRVLKPGAPLLAFGGSRTFHRMTVAIEDASFEIRDCLMWLHGSGFPKHPSQLKPAFEPIILARKPLEGSMAANVAAWGVGGLAIDACRIEARKGDLDGNQGYARKGGGNISMENANRPRAPKPDSTGRWPSNVLLSEEAAAHLDDVVGDRKSGLAVGSGKIFNGKAGANAPTGGGYTDSGGPSRFFYTAKVSTKERNAGCEPGTSTHPTMKPLALTRYLATLIKPPVPDARLLVPFSGAGSEIIGALQAGWTDVTGIEREAEYIAIAEQRVAYWTKPDESVVDDRQTDLFGKGGS